ncbi:MAG: prepilin peptidase [Bdellovibrionales bacterium]|nr:prepilin peptidase [Bdellovibrionales bacterium]
MEMWAVATLTLVAGLVDDLRSRKVHNALVLALLPAVLLASFYYRGFDGSVTGLSAAVLALLVTIPLFAMGVLGGGDVKLFTVFALAVDPTSMFYTLLYSVIWGGLFGLTRSALQKQLFTLVRNTYKLAHQRQRLQAQELHKIPYTIALLLGWFTQLTFLRAGGGL